MSSTGICLNCDKPIRYHSNFCENCGQTTHTHRLSLGHLSHELVHFFTHADKGVFYLLKMLATKPGIVAREYINGRRKKVFSPINFFLLAIGIFLFTMTTFHPLQGGVDLTAVKSQVMKIPDPTTRERRLLKLERIEKGGNFTAKNSNLINFIVTPLIAFYFFICFKKAGLNYTEHLVTNLFIAGFAALFFVFIICPVLLIAKNTSYYLIGVFGFLIFEIFYRSVAYYQLIGKSINASYLRCLLISFGSVLLWYTASTSIMKLYIETGFKF